MEHSQAQLSLRVLGAALGEVLDRVPRTPRRQALACETHSLQTFDNNFSNLKTSHWLSQSSLEASNKPNRDNYSCNKANIRCNR